MFSESKTKFYTFGPRLLQIIVGKGDCKTKHYSKSMAKPLVTLLQREVAQWQYLYSMHKPCVQSPSTLIKNGDNEKRTN